MTGRPELNFRHIWLSAKVVEGELRSVDDTLEGDTKDLGLRVALFKYALIALTNVADLEVSVRRLYENHPDLSAIYKPAEPHFEFAKYLRNRAVGHINAELSEKTFEWKPELYYLFNKDISLSSPLLNLALLETAINTYVDQAEVHKVFDGDTDLNYPPDWTRFMNFLGSTVHVGMTFTAALSEVAKSYIDVPSSEGEMMEMAMKAGLTDFKWLKGPGR